MNNADLARLHECWPWPGARIVDRGAPYVVVDGYWDTDKTALREGRKPFAYMVACPYRGGIYNLRWEPDVWQSKTTGGTFTSYPTVDWKDADTMHNFKRRYPDFDLTAFIP